MVRGLPFIGLACLLVAGCGGDGNSDATLAPLPLPPVTDATIPPTVAPPVVTAITAVTGITAVGATTTTLVPVTTLAPATTTPAISTSTLPTTTPTTSAPGTTTTSVGATTTSIRPGSTDVGPWIMQLASASAATTDTAIAAALERFRVLTPDVTTLRTTDFPGSFTGAPLVIFYVGGFPTRDAVLAECAEIGLPTPTSCLPRQISTG